MEKRKGTFLQTPTYQNTQLNNFYDELFMELFQFVLCEYKKITVNLHVHLSGLLQEVLAEKNKASLAIKIMALSMKAMTKTAINILSNLENA